MSAANDQFIRDMVRKSAAKRERQEKAIDSQIAQPELLREIQACISKSQKTSSIVGWVGLVVGVLTLTFSVLSYFRH